MKSPAKQPYSIRRRIIAQFCLFSVLMSAMFIFLCFNFLYELEDASIKRALADEVSYLNKGFKETTAWPQPRRDYFTLHVATNTLPDNIEKNYLANPRKREFHGLEGRYFHLTELQSIAGAKVYLVGEVSELLMVRQFFDVIAKSLLIMGGLLTLIACFIAYRLAKHQIQPLTDLVKQVDGVLPDQIPANFAKDYPPNEIGILATRLENSLASIKDFVEREQHFTRDASHELRTPIAVVKNAVELLQSSNKLDDSVKPLVERIERAGLQMDQTVTTLLSMARQEPGDKVVEPVKVLPVVEKAIIQHAYLLENKPVEVDVDISIKALLSVPLGIVQILVANLVSNAFQYTDAGEVFIHFDQNRLTIKDTGSGIEEEIKDKLLETMVKGSKSQGFGIGLSIVKRLCEHHGFALSIDNHQGGVAISIEFAAS
jgi:signal transduction histidine kinase